MRDSDWSRQILLRSDWSHPSVALLTTVVNSKYITKLTNHVCVADATRTQGRKKEKI